MIYVVQGKLGAGKSYFCVDLMIRHLLQGGACVSNIDLDWRRLSSDRHRLLRSWQYTHVDATSDPFLLPTGDRRGKGRRRTVVVLDEALNWFASSTAKDDDRKSTWGEWLRQSDKLGQDVYFIAQNFDRAAKWIRELAHVKVSLYRLSGLRVLGIPIFCFFPRLFVAVSSDLQTSSRLATRWGMYDDSVYRYYDTSETFGFSGADSAYAGNDLPPPFRFPRSWLVFAFALVLWVVLAIV